VKEKCKNLNEGFRNGKEIYRNGKEIFRYGNVSKNKRKNKENKPNILVVNLYSIDVMYI
jgi:hypothetical protein